MKPVEPSKLPGWEKVTGHGSDRGVYLQKGLDSSVQICRYMSARNFQSTVVSSMFYMSNVRFWADPFEKAWCDVLFRNSSKLRGVNAYGSCWTTRMRDEPFWRLYQDRCDHMDETGTPLPPPLPPVRIKARISNLISLFENELRETNAKIFIGKVGYCRESALLEWAECLQDSSVEVASDAATALHLKRYAFWFESEIRVLWIDRCESRDARRVPFDPQSLFDGVMIGPSRDAQAAKQLKSRIVAMGLPPTRVKRSLIYRIPRLRRG